ncbi:MAG: hypothetical protein KF753_18320 [Caldilineaceae bacterium]|nr:hypothetical protein [Caldilineaceae bacterium]
MNELVSFRTTTEERQRLDALAHGMGVSNSEFLRRLVRCARIETRPALVLRSENGNAGPALTGDPGVAMLSQSLPSADM